MVNIAYKNHDQEINELINLLLENKAQIILYNSHEGYGDTAFIQRVMYLLHVTEKYQLFYAELSPSVQNPLHEVLKNIVCKKDKLYHRLQLFSDDQNCSQDIPILLTAIIKDLTQSETIATLLKPQEAVPIYAGFYQDRLKQNFFDLIHIITNQQRLLFFIDNIQYMDNNSLYELQALLQNPNVTIILFKSGEGIYFEKLYDEVKYKFSEIELNFPEPDVSYVQKLATIYNRTLSEYEATTILSNNNRNVRKIISSLRKPETLKTNTMLEDQVIKVIYLYDDYITKNQLLKIFSYTPYSSVINEEDLAVYIKNVYNNGLLQSITDIETRDTRFKIVSNINISVDLADNVVISKALSDYYNQCKTIDYKHMCNAWKINSLLNIINRKNLLTPKILLIALKMGYRVPDDIIQYSKQQNDINIKILSATFLFCNANYLQAKTLLENILTQNDHRSLKVMYAISLNRCRYHEIAENELSKLIDSSHNIDEKTILISFLISNHVHNRKLNEAKRLYEKYACELKSSKKYPYFLRNAATIFDAATAFCLRNNALEYFRLTNDFYGYYSTIVNMTSYYLKNKSIEYTIDAIQGAFDKLQQFNASQIHLAANNLGICYFYSHDELNALKYLSLCFEKAQSIMPKGYAAINLSSILLQKRQFDKARIYLDLISEEIRNSKLARLKAHFYFQCAFIEYSSGYLHKTNAAIINTQKYCSPTENSNIYAMVNLIKKYVENYIPYKDEMFSSLYIPCFLEYWTINSIDALPDDFLPRYTI